MSKTAFLFPGQGSQSIGMGQELYEQSAAAKRVFEEVDAALGESLSECIFRGDAQELTQTRNTQPALMAVSLAAFHALQERSGKSLIQLAHYVAGHSLGEYSALAVAGSLSITDTARLLRIRGDAMQEAVAPGKGAMAAILGLDWQDMLTVLDAHKQQSEDICVAANNNAPGQVVISGHSEAVAQVSAAAKQAGAKRAVPLPVSAPFHSPLMAPAAEKMREALQNVDIQPPALPVIANVTARPVTTPTEIAKLLVEQVTGQVRWRETIDWLYGHGVRNFVEIGAGKVLHGLTRKILSGQSDWQGYTLEKPDEIDHYVTNLS